MTVKTTPYWWEARQDPLPSSPLPANTDILIIGSGYTGMHAALAALRAGRSVHLLDKDGLGAGCSSRNGGQIAAELKPSTCAWVQRADNSHQVSCWHTSKAKKLRICNQHKLLSLRLTNRTTLQPRNQQLALENQFLWQV